MAQTTIANLITNTHFLRYFPRAILDRSRLLKSGIVQNDTEIQTRCNAAGFGGHFVKLPFFNPLATSGSGHTEERLVEGVALTPDGITANEDIAVITRRGKAFGATDLSAAISGEDPMKAIADLIADWWNVRKEAKLFSVLKGVFADNVANDNGDLVLDISGETGDGAILDKNTINLAAQLLGDRKTELTAIAMNSAAETFLAGLDTNAGLYRASDGPATLSKYNGRDIFIDDNCAYNPSTKVAEIFLFGKGAVANATVPTEVPFETGRDQLKSQNFLITRVSEIVHVRGVKWNVSDTNPDNDKTGTAGQSGYIAGLSDGGNWDRVYSQKEIRVVKLICKLA